MFPSHNPWFYMLAVIAVASCVAAALYVSFLLNTPAGMLSLLALKYIPEVPMTHDPMAIAMAEGRGGDDDDEPAIGFTARM